MFMIPLTTFSLLKMKVNLTSQDKNETEICLCCSYYSSDLVFHFEFGFSAQNEPKFKCTAAVLRFKVVVTLIIYGGKTALTLERPKITVQYTVQQRTSECIKEDNNTVPSCNEWWCCVHCFDLQYIKTKQLNVGFIDCVLHHNSVSCVLTNINQTVNSVFKLYVAVLQALNLVSYLKYYNSCEQRTANIIIINTFLVQHQIPKRPLQKALYKTLNN